MVPVEDRSCTDECRVGERLVAAHTSFYADGHSLGVALVRVSNNGTVAVLTCAVIATTVFTQQSPDMLWIGRLLVVGSEDGSAVPERDCTRSLTGEILPASDETRWWAAESVRWLLLASTTYLAVVWCREAADVELAFRVRLRGGAVFATGLTAAPLW